MHFLVLEVRGVCLSAIIVSNAFAVVQMLTCSLLLIFSTISSPRQIIWIELILVNFADAAPRLLHIARYVGATGIL